MIGTDVFSENGTEPVGRITTELPIAGSKINDFKILSLLLKKPENDAPIINWILESKLKIPGSPRLQRIWDFKDFETNEKDVVLHGVVLKPDGLCIACGGTGKFQAKRHKATAKCPTCKGHGFTTDVWIDGENNDSGTVVGQSENSSGASGS